MENGECKVSIAAKGLNLFCEGELCIDERDENGLNQIAEKID
jgi:hypothetical protein